MNCFVLHKLRANSSQNRSVKFLDHWNTEKNKYDTLQEHQWILTNATLWKDTDFGFIMVVYENFFKNILKYLKEMKKHVSKLILHKNIIKNNPIKGWGGLSKMSKKMSIIELSWIGQDLFDFSDLTWGHPLTHSSTHRYLQTKSNYINKLKLYYISHLTWPHPLTHPLIHTPIHRCGCLNKS